MDRFKLRLTSYYKNVIIPRLTISFIYIRYSAGSIRFYKKFLQDDTISFDQ